MGIVSSLKKHQQLLKLGGLVVVLILLFVGVRMLPITAWIDALEQLVGRLGWWGPLVFGAVYALAVVLFAPGSALTLAAGAIFGLTVGTVTVSIASTLGAGLAFLVARYLMRDKVRKMAQDHPRFGAVDRAVGEKGWKIVALLRLSPAIPFNLQNYLYGLTAIGFWPYLLTSWIAMLPGTFMYVYIGFIAREGAEAAAGGAQRSTLQWIMTVVGLVATIAVTIYITRVARSALRRQTEIQDQSE